MFSKKKILDQYTTSGSKVELRTGASGKATGFHVPNNTVVNIPIEMDMDSPIRFCGWIFMVNDNNACTMNMINIVCNDKTIGIDYYPWCESVVSDKGTDNHWGKAKWLYGTRGWHYACIQVNPSGAINVSWDGGVFGSRNFSAINHIKSIGLNGTRNSVRDDLNSIVLDDWTFLYGPTVGSLGRGAPSQRYENIYFVDYNLYEHGNERFFIQRS